MSAGANSQAWKVTFNFDVICNIWEHCAIFSPYSKIYICSAISNTRKEVNRLAWLYCTHTKEKLIFLTHDAARAI
jgi:hypothetical protein